MPWKDYLAGERMDIQDIGAIGELTAALATIATLLYLARQIQLGSKTIQASNLSTMVDAMSAMHDTHVQTVDFFEAAQNGDRELSDREVATMHVHCVQMFLGFETVFLFHLNGTVDEAYFRARVRTIRRVGSMPYFRQWFEEWAEDLYDERFVQFVANEWAENRAVLPTLRLGNPPENVQVST